MDSTRALSDPILLRNLSHQTLTRGAAYVREDRVSRIRYDPSVRVASAQVRGSQARIYHVTVELDPKPPFDHIGSCTCPVEVDCKHIAAVLVRLRQTWTGQSFDPPSSKPELTSAPTTWEQDLTGLLGPTVLEPVGTGTLGLRVEVRTTGSGSRLQCRPVRRSPTTGRWVQNGAAWQDVIHDYRRQLPSTQTRLFRRLRNAAAPAEAQFSYNPYASQAWISLEAAEESVWSIFDQLVSSGVGLVGTNDQESVLLSGQQWEAVVDVQTTQHGDLRVMPRLIGPGGRSEVPAAMLGDPVHGFALRRQHPGRSVVELIRLESVIDSRTGGWLTGGRAVQVPAADRDRFLQAFYPSLRRGIAVRSSDGSVELPEPAAPTLRLVVNHPAAEQIELGWSIGYGPAGAGPEFDADDLSTDLVGRDLQAESALWADLNPVLADAAAGVLDPGRPDRPRSRTQLRGLPAAEFSSDLLPRLVDAGVAVQHSGDRTDYQRAEGQPQITVSTEEGEGSSDWFDLSIDVTVNGEQVPFVLLFRALAEGAGHLILPSGLYFSLAQPEFSQLSELIGEARALQDRERSGLRIHVQQAGFWQELTRLGVVGRQAERWQTRVAEVARRESPAEVDPPAALQAELRPYQLEGYRWLHQLWELGLGGILADDMGLGKTLQALALITQVQRQHPEPTPFLVVAPTSVLTTWASEAARFAPGLRVVAVQQTAAKRQVPMAELAAGADVVLTSYTLLRLEAESYQAVSWQGLFLDEAQFVKNHEAKTYGCIRKLGIDFTVAMTGTPLENSLMDLWSMLSLTSPGMFPSPDRFREFFQRPIERNVHPDRLDRLRDRVRPVLLRRTKEEVATELPAKQEQVIEVDLHPQHARIYQRQLQRERQKILGLIGDADANRFTILRSLTLLRQLSLDTALVEGDHPEVPSAKVDLLLEMVTSLVAEGHRALVFSQFTTFLKRIGTRLDGAGVDHAYLDGRTRNRARVIEDFKSGNSGVFLISLKAGGFGLNLTEADYCFVLDPWWNPASEAQAVDRAHRIGQTRPVMVYRLVSKNTIEDKVMQLKSKKQHLFDRVMSSDGMASGSFTAAEIRSLLAS